MPGTSKMETLSVQFPSPLWVWGQPNSTFLGRNVRRFTSLADRRQTSSSPPGTSLSMSTSIERVSLEKGEAFASDRWARWLWWYRRTPHWDETVGLMPAMRLLSPPRFETVPWPGPAAGSGPREAFGPGEPAHVE